MATDVGSILVLDPGCGRLSDLEGFIRSTMTDTGTYTGRSPVTGEMIEVRQEQGRIVAVEASGGPVGEVWIAPGMIDIQVNGFAGVDYNSPVTPLDEIARSIEVIHQTGVSRFLPTVITGSNENIRGSLRNLSKAKRELPGGGAMAGFHVEGPWISDVDGPRGAHQQEHVRAASYEEWKQFNEAAEGNIRILTVAPEQKGVIALIEKVAGENVVVSIGHTNASAQDIRDAIAAGATMSTHLGNGSHQIIRRFPNYIFDQMAADELCAGFIVDGIHLDPNFLKVAIRAKGLEKSIITTDAVAPANCPPGSYRIGDQEVELTADNCVRLKSSGRLAGSALRLDRALEKLMQITGLSLHEALRMATVNAAVGAGIEDRKGFLETGDLADLILFRFDEETRTIQIESTVCAAVN